MEQLDTREWLLTNGLGSFASGTIGDAHTRTYHGWLIAALTAPSQRTLLLSHIDASLDIDGHHVELSCNYWGSGEVSPEGYLWLQSFKPPPVPTWTWATDQWQLSRQIHLPHWSSTIGAQRREGLAPSISAADLQQCHRVLIRYQYSGVAPATLTLRPLIGDRYFHHQQRAEKPLQFSQMVNDQQLLLQATRPQWSGTPWYLRWTRGTYTPDGLWYWDYCYPEETRRGLSDSEDLYSPGVIAVVLHPGQTVTLEAQVGWSGLSETVLSDSTFEEAVASERDRLQHHVFYRSDSLKEGLESEHAFDSELISTETAGDRPLKEISSTLWFSLLYAGDQFIAHRPSISGPTIMAGYPWFGDWGRDTLIAIPGLTLTTQRFALARQLLRIFAQHCEQGLIPNAFPDQSMRPYYNNLDVALWWIEILGLYLQATRDWDFLEEQYPIVHRIYKAFITGTLHNIRVDAVDGLLTWNSPSLALTWMDATVNDEPITPRTGKPIEINALWYSGLCWARQWAEHLQIKAMATGNEDNVMMFSRQVQRYERQLRQVRESLKIFWNPRRGYFYDTIYPDDSPDPSIRPNAIIALSLAHCGFSESHSVQALDLAHNRLLTAYGLRSLDPANPDYQGRYEGDMYARDRAYHQGTVWSWLIGPFIRAWKRFHPDRPIPFNPAPLLTHIAQQGCLGSVAEIFDGDTPHLPRGAVSQAWSVAEIIRHWSDLT